MSTSLPTHEVFHKAEHYEVWIEPDDRSGLFAVAVSFPEMGLIQGLESTYTREQAEEIAYTFTAILRLQ